MNMHAAPQRTPAETVLLKTFEERIAQLPGDPAVNVKRDEAVEVLKLGLPTRHVEAWHYTDLRRLLSVVPDYHGEGSARVLQPLVEGSTVLPLLDGTASGRPVSVDGLASQPLREKLADGSFAPALTIRDDDDTVGALNAALVADGWFADIAAGAIIKSPIELQKIQAGGQAHMRLAVRVGAGAKATIVERLTGTGLESSVSHLLLGDDADILWVVVQDTQSDAIRLSQFNASMGRNAKLTIFIMNAGGKLVRQEIRVSASGEGGAFTLRGVNLLSGSSHTDVTMVLDHEALRTTSTEVVRNVVTDKAHGVFQGRINVHQKAQKTDARMACNTLLLSDDAEFSTKPELEIFADDVQCGHGATVTEIDRNHLFYLMARGIDEKSARALLIKAFVAEIVEEIEHEGLVVALEERLDAWFTAHG